MPTYDFECELCGFSVERHMSIADLASIKLYCTSCPEAPLHQVILDPPMMTIPGNMTHDGIHKVVGTPNSKQKLIRPIQLTEELPDGRTKITTLGDPT